MISNVALCMNYAVRLLSSLFPPARLGLLILHRQSRIQQQQQSLQLFQTTHRRKRACGCREEMRTRTLVNRTDNASEQRVVISDRDIRQRIVKVGRGSDIAVFTFSPALA